MFSDKMDLVGVFDGHNGVDVANFVSLQLSRLIERSLKKEMNVPKAMMQVRLPRCRRSFTLLILLLG